MKQAHDNLDDFAQRLVEGDEQAYTELYERYAEPMYRYIYFRIGSEVHAEDLMQEMFVKFVDIATRTKKKPKNINAYLYQIARNLIVDHYREHTRQDIEIEAVVDDSMQISGQEETHVEVQFLTEAIKEMKPLWQEIIILKHVEGLSHEEIAEALGKSPTYIRVNLHRAVTQLKKKLQ